MKTKTKRKKNKTTSRVEIKKTEANFEPSTWGHIIFGGQGDIANVFISKMI